METKELVKQLEQFDNKHGYRLSYEEVKKNLQPIINEIVSRKEECLELLHELMQYEETWSSLFALETLKEIKSEKSIRYLIDYIKNNEDGDYFESCEEAMYGLQAIGKSAIAPLLEEVSILFKNEEYLFYLIGSLTAIKDEQVYAFMASVCEDYLLNQDKYADWFKIHDFICDFDKQENKYAISLLKRILSLGNLSEMEIIEIKDTIEVMEDPVGFKTRIDEEVKRLKKIENEGKRKLGRNDPCHCGSEIKYKKCCLDDDIKEFGSAIKL